ERKPHEAAAIEAWEEAGVRGGMAKKPVGRYTYLEGLDNRDVAPGMMDLFQIAVSEIRADFREHGQRQLDWVPDEAATPCPGGKLKSVL
ncbi:hypothetical protein, partial [Paraburkholderia sp. SIMBA_027]|uniref:hypothetical protein n=1 Tax=Paraburkholderia sp. SIMBA_027 TaxID=3085770 RepID=UPI00397AA9C0